MVSLLHRATIKKKEERRNRMKIYMVSLLHRATIKERRKKKERNYRAKI